MDMGGVCLTTSDQVRVKHAASRSRALHTPTWVRRCWPIEGFYFNLLAVADGWARKGSGIGSRSSAVPEKVALAGLSEFKAHQSNAISPASLRKGLQLASFYGRSEHVTPSSLSASAHPTWVCLRPSTESICGSDAPGVNIYRPDVLAAVSLKTWLEKLRATRVDFSLQGLTE